MAVMRRTVVTAHIAVFGLTQPAIMVPTILRVVAARHRDYIVE